MPLDYETLGDIVELIDTLLDYVDEHPDDHHDASLIERAERTLKTVRAALLEANRR